MKVIATWSWIPLVGLAMVAWGLFAAPRPEPTAIFSVAAVTMLAGGAVFLVGALLIVVFYTREQERIRDLRHRGL